MDEELLVWIDVECTTLKPEDGVLLEVGAIVTDWDLNERGTFHELVYNHGDWKESMDDFVCNMHTENGLLDDLDRLGENDGSLPFMVQDRLVDFIDSFAGKPKNKMPAGNNVQRFDLDWLACHMPGVPERMFYRTLDISTLWEAIRVRRRGERPPKNEAHRVLDDCRESMQLWKMWCELTGL